MATEYHYVYKLTNPTSGEFYYGSRTCKCNPNDDTYMGSMVSWKVDKSILIKEIINTNFDNREDALKYEANIIKQHINNKLNRNYNIPGEGFCNLGKVFTEEHINKLKKSHLGNVLTTEHKEKISKSLIGRFVSETTKQRISNALTGIQRSDETKEKISVQFKKNYKKSNHPFFEKTLTDIHKKNLRKSKINKCKAVVQLDFSGNIITEYISTSMASNETNISKVDIRRVCMGIRNSAGGYKWKYKK